MTPMFTRDQLYAANGNHRTKSLFREWGVSDENILAYTTGSTTNPHPDMRKLFLKYVVDDPTEATFALALFGEVEFWTRLSVAPWLKPYLKKWRHEADVTRKSMAFQYVINEVKLEGKNSYQAAKFLIDEPWKKTPAQKKDAKESTEEALNSNGPLQSDIKRLQEAGLFQH